MNGKLARPPLNLASRLSLLAATAVLAVAAPAPAQIAIDRLTIIAPAAPGGGWDQTARAMQHALEAGEIVPIVQVVNVPGAAGTIGLAQLLSDHAGDGRTLLVTGLVMVGAIAFSQYSISPSRLPVSLARVTPIARLTGEHEVVAVPAGSPLRSMRQLLGAFADSPSSIAWGGGSAGGTDHILAGLIVATARLDPRRVNYIAYSGGGEAVAALLGDQVTVGISGYGEFAPHLRSGRLRALAVSSPVRLPGLDAPTLLEQGLDVDLANWRAVVAPPGLSDSERRVLEDVVGRLVRSAEWRRTLSDREWADLYLSGEDFARFLDDERLRVTRIVRRLRRGDVDIPGARAAEWAFPVVVFVGLVLIGLGLAIEARMRGAAAHPRAVGVTQSFNRRAVLWLGAGLALYLALLGPAGFIVASTVLFTCAAAAFDSRRPARDLLVGLLFSSATYAVFEFGLDLQLPAAGIFSWTR